MCAACLSPGGAAHRADLRRKYSGVPKDGAGCNFTPLTVSATPAVKDSLTPARPKPARAPQDVIELRVLMPCEHRTPEGRCPLSKTCRGNCTCRTVAEWRKCPADLW